MSKFDFGTVEVLHGFGGVPADGADSTSSRSFALLQDKAGKSARRVLFRAAFVDHAWAAAAVARIWRRLELRQAFFENRDKVESFLLGLRNRDNIERVRELDIFVMDNTQTVEDTLRTLRNFMLNMTALSSVAFCGWIADLDLDLMLQTSSVFENIKRCSFILYQQHFPDEIVSKCLDSWTALERLEIRTPVYLWPVASTLLHAAPSVRYLRLISLSTGHLYDVRRWDPVEDLGQLGRSLRNVRRLVLDTDIWNDNPTLPSLFQGMECLESVELDVDLIGRSVVQALKAPRLRKVKIRGYQFYSSMVIGDLLDANPSLFELDLSGIDHAVGFAYFGGRTAPVMSY